MTTRSLVLLVLSCTAFVSWAETALCEDERAALGFLDFVSAPMSAADEREWWDVGGRQFGLFAKRYHIAFAGYAAAALGMRGTDEEKRRVGRVLDNCIRRMLARDVWAYSQSKKYWGEKPWAPDPCYRENVMYTGHLLQLLALYETFTHDTKYWTQGFDFEWNKEKRVHYDVQKLIDVTVAQMRTNAFCGVTCEPGLLFFPCNNHPHFALKLFSGLGHGDWTDDARRWERWALDHFLSPCFGGGAINLLCHVKTGVFYPRGSSGLDGWSLLWYEPWAEKRETSLALWKTAAAKIDWDVMDAASDAARKFGGCSDPLAVPHSVAAAFLAAAARANDDPVTAARLEKAVDVHLVRTNGLYYLNLNREWRVGASAQRIIALALANGSSFRTGLAPNPSFAAETARYSLFDADVAAERLRAYLKSDLRPSPKADDPALAFAGEAECRRAVELLASDHRAARTALAEVERRWVRWHRAPLKPGETPDRPDMPHVNGWHGKDVPTDYAAAVMIRTYLAFARAGASPDAAAKAKLLTAAMTYAQKTNGCLPTFWTGKLREEDSRADAMEFSLAVLEEAAEFFRPAQDSGVTWVRGTDLPMEGCGYADAFPYQRLPLRFQRKMPAVDVGLGRHSTGLSFRFRTESSVLRLKWTLLSACLAMPHMPSTGTSGLDVYARTGTGPWRFVRNLRPKGRVNEASFGWTPGDECWIYLPPYNGLVDLSAGFDAGKGPLPAAKHAGAGKPVVMYGHSITQGGCSGRPGTIWPTLVGRWLDVEVVNLGFSGSGHMQPEWAQAVADIEASCYVIDTVDNVDMEMIRTRYESFIRTLRARHPGVPVLCLENTVLIHPEVDRERNAAVRAIVAKFAAEGGAPVEIVRTAEMIPDDECTVDGAHLNDWGMMNVARAVAARIKSLRLLRP